MPSPVSDTHVRATQKDWLRGRRGGGRMAEKWMQSASRSFEAKGTKGLFRRQAERHGMSTKSWAEKQKGSSNPQQRKRAIFALNAMRSN